MLEGLEVSEVKFSELQITNYELRLDAEYFSKKNIELNRQLDKVGFQYINDFAFVTDGIHTSIDYCEDSNVKLVSATSPRENYFDFSRNVFISEKAHSENPRTALKIDDIIVSTVGTIGNCAVVKESDLPANSDRHVGIIRLNDRQFLSNYISTFLLSKYGRFQTLRESTGNVQLNLFIYKIKALKIANLSIDFQNKIEETVKLAHSKREQSQTLYRQAEELLLENIFNHKEHKGITKNTKELCEPCEKNFVPFVVKENYNIKSFKESFLETGRLDAEYYQPKYEELIKHIETFETERLNAIVSIKKSIEPGSDAYETDGIPFIRVSNLSKFGLTDTDIYLDKSKFGNLDLQPKKDTILLSKDGSVGIAYKIEQDLDVITSGALLHLTVTNKDFLPDYVTLILNSEVVKMQAERDAGGSIIQHWKPSEIEQVIIPKIPLSTQHQISALIQESFALRKESERLLAEAKGMVEREVEKEKIIIK